MTIEKPISTIRKAIKGSAELEAEKEGRKRPKKRHFREAFQFFRFLKMIDPKMYEGSLELMAKAKDLKDEMGEDLYKTFTSVLEEITSKIREKVKKEYEQIKEKGPLSSEEILELNKKIIIISNEEMKNDSRLISAFLGKEELLNKTIDFISSEMLHFVESEVKNDNGFIIL
jgi:hypothetical protein